MNMYQEELLDHFKYPRNNTPLDNPNFSSDKKNPSCGDVMHIEGIIVDNILTKVAFQGTGCVISQATASMLTEQVLGKKTEHILALTDQDILDLIGIELGPVRIKCALLSLQALQEGISKFRQQP
ncbi:iron-sulfur cluster assembly scaffold protein [bacterium]|nr:MAG: iron-sulfur cluster assembly scaffold protein [bacterium]